MNRSAPSSLPTLPIVSQFLMLGVITFLSATPFPITLPANQLHAETLVLPVPNSVASTQAEMKPYAEIITDSEVTFEMLPIPGGTFLMGSPEEEEGRQENEGPQHRVEVEPFWMGKHEISWDEYEIFMFNLDLERRKITKKAPTELDKLSDAVVRPTKPYVDMTFGLGRRGYPAICMTQLAAKNYCQWLSAKTGRYYRLPTEAEWEYACRAGTTTAYSFGDDPEKLTEYGWFFDLDSDTEGYHKVGKLKPNPWGLYDMHGNVAEWCLDRFDEDFYSKFADVDIAKNPFDKPVELYPRVVRGGSWDDDPEDLRSASRRGSDGSWKRQDPQLPQSVWYHTDAQFVGFRIVRPLRKPTEEELKKFAPDDAQDYRKARR